MILLTVLCCVLNAGCKNKKNSAWLAIDKVEYNPGEQIQLTYEAPSSFDENAWIGIIPSKVKHGSESENDNFDISYQYIQKKTSGTMIFQAPTQPGSYDLRMNDSDSNGREVTSLTFMVKGEEVQTSPEADIPAIRLEKTEFFPGAEIKVSFTAPASFVSNAWIGIVPSNVPHGDETENDRYDLTYQYLNGRTSGELVFQAPINPGSYDLRMNDTDSNGVEAAFAAFQVMRLPAEAPTEKDEPKSGREPSKNGYSD